MTEPKDALDRRASRAADELRGVAAERTRPTLDPDRRTNAQDGGSTGRTPRILAIAAVLALVAGAAAILWTRGTDDPDELVAGTAEEIPGHILDPTPDGFTAMATEMDGATRRGGEGDNGEFRGDPWYLYGPAGERAELGVIVNPDGFDELRPVWGEDGESEVFDLAGRRAYRDVQDFGAFGSNAIVVEVDDVAVAVFGGAAPDVVEAVAAEVTVDDGVPVIAPSTLLEGWEPGEVVDPASINFTYLDYTADKAVFYMTEELDEEGPGFTMIQVVAGGEAAEPPPDLGGVLPLVEQKVDEVEVNGHPGVVLTSPVEDDGIGVYTVAWEPEPGWSLRVAVFGFGIAPSDAVALAETVRPATDEEWRALLDQAEEIERSAGMSDISEQSGVSMETADGSEVPLPQPTIPEVERSDDPLYDRGWVGSGMSPDLSWVAEIEGGMLSIRIKGADDETSDPVSLAEPFGIASATTGDHMVLAGIVDGNQDVAVEEDGERVRTTWTMELREGRTFWAAQVGHLRVSVTVFDADGSEVAQHGFDHASS